MEEKVEELRCKGEVKMLQYIVVEYTRLFCHVFVCVASFTYFGEVLRCPHKRIITITKVYIARNTIHVEIIRFQKN